MQNYFRFIYLFGIMFVLAIQAMSLPKSPVYYREMNVIIQRADLSDSQKIEKIRPYLQRSESRISALGFMSQLDKKAAREAAISCFRLSKISQVEKLELGDYILNRTTPDDFQDEYAKFLLTAVLNGEKEFMRVHEEGTKTAIGEYAKIAAGFSGYKPALFDRMKDQRVIPILIRCLKAPDEVWPKDQGCIVFGKPGESSGRNIARVNIPVALARLNAVSAVDVLRKLVYTYHDIYLRYESAYALGRLIKTTEIDEQVKKIRKLKGEQDNRNLLFHFGKGLIERGEVTRGIEFMSFEYSIYRDKSEDEAKLYMLGERLTILQNVKNPATETFYREAITYAPLKAIFLDAGTQQTEQQRKYVIETYKHLLSGIRENNLTSLSPLVKDIAVNTKNLEIRKASDQLLTDFNAK